ncbi:hypothetical protein F5876DRAFT_90116 [Lentinula aff. lateritia]|uniref:Uncharacterized protein n=1 Tax=Lentinula aff. lateritia TaxID=2804960 RepID=A0ACC1TUG3_9AGAR|nr:hypothetical protein F5876DRAFT_90116 [Lentinula aff. lateritia]
MSSDNKEQLPGEHFEPCQTAISDDYTPDQAKSFHLEPAKQRLVDDILALYSCKPTVERVKRYSSDCVYNDQFVYANDRYKMAVQWFASPKLFSASVNNGYQVSWTFRLIPKTARVTGLVSLSLDPSTIDSDFIQVKYHKDQANDKDYSHEDFGFSFKKYMKKYGTGNEEGNAPKEDFTKM